MFTKFHKVPREFHLEIQFNCMFNIWILKSNKNILNNKQNKNNLVLFLQSYLLNLLKSTIKLSYFQSSFKLQIHKINTTFKIPEMYIE